MSTSRSSQKNKSRNDIIRGNFSMNLAPYRLEKINIG